MADDKLNTGTRDRERISLSEDYEVRDWSQKLNVSANELRDAVRQVGNIASDVAQYLKTGINK